MLSLRRGTVVSIERPAAGVRGIERMTVEIDGVERSAYADVGMVGGSIVGDDVVVNTEALDLELGSGGSDIVVVNLTRGLEGKADSPAT